MTILEVVAELRAQLKPYVGKMPHSTFFTTLAAIEDGSAKRSTIATFFQKFGYVGDYNEWHKEAVVLTA